VVFVNLTASPAADLTLTAADRCDRCGAQARVRVGLASGELLFCGHHATEHEPVLRDRSLSWYDEREHEPA
jgi:hypothetical protein